MESLIRLRLSQKDVQYGGNLVDGAKILALFGDAATELLISNDQDEGLFLTYEKVEFKAPVYAGDFIEIKANLVKKGASSRRMEFKAYKVIASCLDQAQPSWAKKLIEPQLVAQAEGICVVPKERQRGSE